MQRTFLALPLGNQTADQANVQFQVIPFSVLAGIELMHMIRNDQFKIAKWETRSVAERFYMLARQVRPA